MRENTFDVLIIGGGPIGLACGIEAKKRGLSYIIIEKGCLVNSIYHYPTYMTFFSTSKKIEIGGVPFVSHLAKPNRLEALEYYRRVKEMWDLAVQTYEKVEDMIPNESGYNVTSSKGSYHARSVVVATGFYDHANLMNVPGEDLPHVKHYYDEPHPYAGEKVLIVGGANSAVDAALEIWRKGGEVHMVVRKEAISHRVKYWIKPDVENRIKEGSIKAYFQSTVKEVREGETDLSTPEGIVTVKNDFVLALTGYKPDFAWLKHIGISISDDDTCLPERDEKTFESNMPKVYLAGTVCGGMNTNKWFIENSIDHAEIIIEDVVKKLGR